MCPAIEVNRHRGLAPDELTRKYRQTRDAVHEDELLLYDEHHDDYDDHDAYWAPQRGWTADDYLVLGALEQSIGFACRKPKLGELFPGALARFASDAASPAPQEARPRHAPEEVAEALFAHVERLVAEARENRLAFGSEIEEALVRIDGGVRSAADALDRFAARPSPIIMALLFTPFWVRPLSTFRVPEGDDDAVTRALLEHLFQVYPVPRALQQPWLAEGLPSLKWVSWLILLGQGGNLHRAARRFGWNIAKRFTHHFSTAPDDLTALEACMWSEIARVGGQRVDLDRLRRNPAYVLDPTDVPLIDMEPDPAGASSWAAQERREEAARVERTHAFWHETVAWLVRWREELTDESSAVILEWAMHLHTESIRRWAAPGAQFSWRGREPASAHAAALEYRRLRETPYGDFVWEARGLDWESSEGEAPVWTVRELTSSRALAEESRAMHHCVASYAYRCARGQSAIFSLCAGGIRKVTIELDPFSHRMLQIRGACNRVATAEELVVLARWLQATAPERR